MSIKNVDFELPVPSIVVQKWKYFFRKFNHDSITKPDAYYVINYEELAKEPEFHLKQLCDFVGILYDESVFNFHEKKDDILKIYPPGFIHNYHSSLMQKVKRWKRQGIMELKLFHMKN